MTPDGRQTMVILKAGELIIFQSSADILTDSLVNYHPVERLGFGHVWITQGSGDVNRFLSVFKQRVTDNFMQGWNEEISNSSRANTYKLMADFNFKLYLDFVTIHKKVSICIH